MNFFQKNNIIIWVLTVLLIVAISALGTMVYHRWYGAVPSPPGQPCDEKCSLLSEELGLTSEQEQKVEQIRVGCRKAGMAITDSLQIKRSELMTELSKEAPDTVYLRGIAQKIGQLQAQLTNQTITQYLKISKECSPEQREKLSSLYHEMMGCCKQGKGNRFRSKCEKPGGN
jgi:Spy/CpxP family protein refolding chaperone